MEYLTFNSIKEAYQKMAAISPQIMWRTDRDACLRLDAKDKRGYLIINPELDLGEMDVDGCIIEKDGIEYRVVIQEDLRGMRKKDAEGNETDEINPGYWMAPPPSLEEMMGKPLFDITDRIHHPTVKQVLEPSPMPFPSTGIFDEDKEGVI
jgi:hypothetical protein